MSFATSLLLNFICAIKFWLWHMRNRDRHELNGKYKFSTQLILVHSKPNWPFRVGSVLVVVAKKKYSPGFDLGPVELPIKQPFTTTFNIYHHIAMSHYKVSQISITFNLNFHMHSCILIFFFLGDSCILLFFFFFLEY